MTTTNFGTARVPLRGTRPGFTGRVRRNLLLVDAEPVFPRLLQSWLEERGWRVTMERSRRRALARVAEMAPSVVLAGLDIGHLDGFEFIEQLHRISPGVPVVLCAPHVAVGTWSAEVLSALGIARAFVRPLRFQDLEKELLRLGETERFAGESPTDPPAATR